MSNEWISVKDETPQDMDWYLVYQGNYRFCRVYEMGLWVDSKEDKYGEVTHWQHLPSPPDTGEK